MLQLPPLDIYEIGIDEAGRGALAFPVCSAAVILPFSIPDDTSDYQMKMLNAIKDSKKMSKKQRSECASFIKEYAIAYDVNFASVEEIDRLNILNATFLSMHRCIKNVLDTVRGMGTSFDNDKQIKILVDGDRFRPYFDESDAKILPYTCVCNGDGIHMNIAAASILAKVGRDDLISQYCDENRQIDLRYGFSSHKAYGTKKHMIALRTYGPLEVHRRSFGPVKNNAQTQCKDENENENESERSGHHDDNNKTLDIKHFNLYKNVIAFREEESSDEE